MMISSEGTHFGLNFVVIQIYDRDLKPTQFVGKLDSIPPGELSRLAKGEIPDLEKAHRQLELQFAFEFVSWLAARNQQVVRIFKRQFCHIPNLAANAALASQLTELAESQRAPWASLFAQKQFALD
jgi:hypothetical protein